MWLNPKPWLFSEFSTPPCSAPFVPIKTSLGDLDHGDGYLCLGFGYIHKTYNPEELGWPVMSRINIAFGTRMANGEYLDEGVLFVNTDCSFC